MKSERTTQIIVAATLIQIILAPAVLGTTDTNDPNRYLNAVREFADNVVKLWGHEEESELR